MSVKKQMIRGGTRAVLEGFAFLARAERGPASLGHAFIGAVGTAVGAARAPGPTRDPESLGRGWQRAFGSPREVPIVDVDATTVRAEIHTLCPLRGTGDLTACHRMMAYDRRYAERMGARFVVLKSQASPGVERCLVALRPADLPHDDLVEAHVEPRSPQEDG